MSNPEDTRQADLGQQLQEVADSLEVSTFEQSPVLWNSIFLDFYKGRGIQQGHVEHAMRSFREMIQAVMPLNTVSQYIEAECEHLRLPLMDKETLSPTIAPGWNTLNNRSYSGAEWRKHQRRKFTQQEVMDYLTFARRVPEIITAVFCFQQHLGNYVEEVEKRVDQDRQDLKLALRAFKAHWSSSGNVPRFIPISLFMSLDKQDEPRDALQGITQETCVRAFVLLEEMEAFSKIELPPPQAPPPSSAVSFHCPAHGLLRQLIVQRSVLYSVLKTVRTLVEPTSPSPAVGQLRAHCYNQCIVSLAQIVEMFARADDVEGYGVIAGDKKFFEGGEQWGDKSS